MGLRFHKSLRIARGLRLNLSKTGPSLSLGGKGLTFNLGKKGTRTTLGLPGSGLSYSSHSKFGGKSTLIWIGLLILYGLYTYLSQ
jgi:hypothetical protein